ncbi:MAG: hypothetical protein SGARI_005764, partial [Bacillariaceae sp.]
SPALYLPLGDDRNSPAARCSFGKSTMISASEVDDGDCCCSTAADEATGGCVDGGVVGGNVGASVGGGVSGIVTRLVGGFVGIAAIVGNGVETVARTVGGLVNAPVIEGDVGGRVDGGVVLGM